MNYYEHHLGDYMRDTAHLSMLEDGAYRRLLDCYYSRESPLPADLKQVYRLVRAHGKPDQQAVASVLEEFFTLTEEGWRHRRCDAEIEKVHLKSESARRSAEQRWAAKRTQSERNANASETHMRKECDTDTERIENAMLSNLQTPDTRLQTPDKPKTRATRAVVASLPDGLDLDAWTRWVDYRSEIRKPIKPASMDAAARKLAAFGEMQAATVENSIAEGYQGLIPPKPPNGSTGNRPTRYEQAMSALDNWKPDDTGTTEAPVAITRANVGQ